MNSLQSKAGYFAAMLLVALSACGGERTDDAPPQKWKNMEVRVETRPSPPRSGMNEVLVMVTDTRGRPGYNMIVSLRSSDQDQWRQAIQDGQVGVYRRAIDLAPGDRSVLQVQLKTLDGAGVLRFPLKLRP